MPPGPNPLSSQQIDLLQRWIAAGARWELHWSFKIAPLPIPPPVEAEDWVRNSIDRFVLQRLSEAGIAPAPEAERRVLVRRLWLDLIGLLPDADVVDAFCSDARPDYYEQEVDRLLASPHFGERWGRHWLDQARYADSDGFEVDGPRPYAWRWRDWVIDALNADTPFDQFTIEQIAGDLLPESTPMQTLATGFLRQSLTNREGGIDQGEARYRELVDRLNSIGTVWLGLTLGCAQCHNHPYDPLTQREYFELDAFLQNTEDVDLKLTADRKLKIPGNKEESNEIAAGVISSGKGPHTVPIYHRGDYLQPRDTVEPGIPRFLESLPLAADEAGVPSRLDLARWLVDPQHPLTARVAANQLWIRLFGDGLVRTPDDFGAQGAPPTHPELLDWLAAEYRARSWSTKEMIRLIVTSATYRQSSVHRPDLAHTDPLNRLWHRQNRLRVEAELVRDLNLCASGLLCREIGGPCIYPPMPAEVAKLSFRSNYKWPTSTGPDRYRRGLYIFYKRTLPYPNLDAFDCPDATTALMRRETSNTPLQALTTLNNEVFWESAQAFGRRVLQQTPPGDSQRIRNAFQICLSRNPTDNELQQVTTLLATNRDWLQQHPQEAEALAGVHRPPDTEFHEAAAWVCTLSVILNLDEFLTRE